MSRNRFARPPVNKLSEHEHQVWITAYYQAMAEPEQAVLPVNSPPKVERALERAKAALDAYRKDSAQQ